MCLPLVSLRLQCLQVILREQAGLWKHLLGLSNYDLFLCTQQVNNVFYIFKRLKNTQTKVEYAIGIQWHSKAKIFAL